MPFLHVLGESHYILPGEHAYDDTPELTNQIVSEWAFEPSRGRSFFTRVAQFTEGKEAEELDRRAAWADIAYSNFVQSSLPAARTAPTQDMWERARRCFFAQLAITRPTVLIVLGDRLWQQLPCDRCRRLTPLQIERGGAEVDDAWQYRYSAGGTDESVIAVKIVHPSGRGFNWRVAAERVNIASMYARNLSL